MTLSRGPLLTWAWPILTSLALHGLVLVGAVSLAKGVSSRAPAETSIAIKVVDMPFGTEAEAALFEPPAPAASSPKQTDTAPSARPVSPAPSPNASDTIVDLKDVVLSNPGASVPSNVPTQSNTSSGAGTTPGSGRAVGLPTGVVGVPSLSRRPQPLSDIRADLERNYPRKAQAMGIEGSAQVRLRVLPDGKPTQLTLSTQTGQHGFGEACIKTLQRSRWSPPLDRKGTPVATDIIFTCVFEIRY